VQSDAQRGARSFDFLDGDVDTPDPNRTHGGKRVGHALLHLARRLRKHEPVARRQLQPHARLTKRDVDVEPTASTTDLHAVNGLRGLDDETGQGRRSHRDRACWLRNDEAHAAPTAANCVSSRKLVEYRPLRNASLARISIAAARVVGTPRSSSSPSAPNARSIVESRSSSHTTSLPINES